MHLPGVLLHLIQTDEMVLAIKCWTDTLELLCRFLGFFSFRTKFI